MHGRSGAWALVVGASMAVAACSGAAPQAISGGSTSGGEAQSSSGSGTSIAGTGASGTGTAGTGAAGAGASGAGASGTGGKGAGGSGAASGTGGSSAGVCGDASDQSILAQHNGDITSEEALCDGVITCLQTSLGLSLGCASCYASAWVCFSDVCPSSCVPNPSSAACKACVAAACPSTESACAGVVPGS